MKKKLLSAVLAAFTAVAMYASVSVAENEPIISVSDDEETGKIAFTDVSETNPFYEDISYAFKNGIMKGISDTEFAPSEALTRAMLVTILYRYEGEPAFMNDLVFTDVENGSYYEKAVVWANGKGIVNGVSQTEFAPDMNITREQIAAILYRYALYKEIPIEKASADTNTLSFDDIADISEYACTAVHCCLATGVLVPRGMKIEPTANATRAESAHAIKAIGNICAADLPSYEELEGEYQDMISERATLSVSSVEDGVDITVLWGNSASETVQWTMKASYSENGELAYSDCTKKILTTNENGSETEKIEYKNGTGYFSVFEDSLSWNGASEESCTDCIFRKMQSEIILPGMPNPMVEVTADEFVQKTGFSLGVPEGATGIKYYIISSELGEMMFMLDGMEYTARIKASDKFEDISGMYFNWTVADDCTVKGRSGKTMRYISKEENSMDDLCLWYDAAPGIMYSLSTYDTDLSGFDIIAIAEKVFIPMQGEVE